MHHIAQTRDDPINEPNATVFIRSNILVAQNSPFGDLSVNASNLLVVDFDVVPAHIFADPTSYLFNDASNPLNWFTANKCANTGSLFTSYCLPRSFFTGANGFFGQWIPDYLALKWVWMSDSVDYSLTGAQIASRIEYKG